MTSEVASTLCPRDTTLLWWCVAGSVLAHVLLLKVLPDWKVAPETPPVPLKVELREPPPPVIEPPQPLPRERPKPLPVKPEPVKATPRDERPLEPPPTPPILTAPPEAPVKAAMPVVPAQRPAPPPPPAPEPPRAAPAPPPPVTPPRSDAAHLSNPPPNYPLAARRRGDHGIVLLRLMVTAEGTAKQVAIEKSSGHRLLDEAAVAAVSNWRFVPARQGGQAIEWPYTQSILFKLD